MDYFQNLDRIIKEEIDKGNNLAVYPFGKIGMQANDIIKHRYGRNAILIDNNLAVYNKNIITIDDFFKNRQENTSILLCAINSNLNNELYADLLNRNLSLIIRNVLEPPVKYVPSKEMYFKQIKELCMVKKAKGYDLKRIGAAYDGGYIMLDDFSDENITYSFGIGNDISWDEYVLSKGASVYCFDPTIDKLPKDNKKLVFEKIGIAGKDNELENLYSLETILKENGHAGRENMILKMDVEGAEWDFLENISSEILSRFSQISFELHDITDEKNAKRIIGGLSKLQKTHSPIWIHANNNGGLEIAGNVQMPKLLEVTYANREKYVLEDTSYDCPISLDAPNVDGFLDIELKNWGKF